MEEIYRQAAGLKVIAENIGVIVLLGSCDALFFMELVDGRELVAKARGGFELLGLGRGDHAGGQRALQFSRTAFEKKLRVADRFA